MGDVLADGSNWLTDQLREHVSRTVAYRRGAVTVSVPATVGKTFMRVADEYGSRVRVIDRDYLLDPADMALGGIDAPPRRGDVIAETVEGVVLLYEVLAPPGEDVWRWSDTEHRRVRVHTKYVGIE